MTEAMRRELIVAQSIARAQGIDLANASPEVRQNCHAIAQAALPGVNRLMADAVANTQAQIGANFEVAFRKGKSSAYQIGFEDGRAGQYNNLWEGQEEWLASLEELTD